MCITETKPSTLVLLLVFLLKFGASNKVASPRFNPCLSLEFDFFLIPSSLCIKLPYFLLHKQSNDRRNLCNFTSQLLPKRFRFVFQLRSVDWYGHLLGLSSQSRVRRRENRSCDAFFSVRLKFSRRCSHINHHNHMATERQG